MGGGEREEEEGDCNRMERSGVGVGKKRGGKLLCGWVMPPPSLEVESDRPMQGRQGALR